MTKVNLDEIFPKEITKQSPQYNCERDYYGGYDCEESASPSRDDDNIAEALANYFNECITPEHIEAMTDKGLAIDVVAYDDYDADDGELARRRIRLSLTVEIIEDGNPPSHKASGEQTGE